MINLIPPRGYTALKHEYVLRVASVYGFMFAVVFLASAALLLPTYVLTSSQLDVAEVEGADIDKTKEAFDIAFGEIRIANTIMAQLNKPKDVHTISAVIEEIVRVAPKGVVFSTFMAAREGTELREIRVQGVAQNRVTLATFKNTLESSPIFTEALVPISDLARDADLPFVITLTLAPEVLSTESETP